MNCAPASILRRVFSSSNVVSAAHGLPVAPRNDCGAPLSSLPVMSWPSRRPRAAASISSVVRSNTPFASGWSPFFGLSPVMNRKLPTPSSAAPSRSAWIAIRFRSRAVTWTMGSTPRSISSRATAFGSTAMRARGDSVRLMASAYPFRASAFAKSSVRSVPLGGVSSVVTTNAFARIFSSSFVIGRY